MNSYNLVTIECRNDKNKTSEKLPIYILRSKSLMQDKTTKIKDFRNVKSNLLRKSYMYYE